MGTSRPENGSEPVAHLENLDELAQIISQIASVSHVRQKEPLTPLADTARITPIRRPSR